MRLVFLGSGSFGVPTLKALYHANHEIVLVGTQPAKPAGRGRHCQATPIAEAASQLGLACREFETINTPEMAALLGELKAQLVVVIAFGQKIGRDLLTLPGLRWINLHGSLLPSYRGAAPINWAIINGERAAGVTVMEINEIFDGGAIFAKASALIGEEETAGELHDRLAELGPDLVLQVIHDIAHGCDHPLAQDDTQASKAPKLRKEQALIDWSQDAEVIGRQCRGMYPWPGAYSFLYQQGKQKVERVVIARATASEGGAQTNLTPGTFTTDLNVACGPGVLKIVEIQPQNSKLMPFKDFVNGRRIMPGDSFQGHQ